MFTVLLSTIGSGVICGTLGTHRGTGVIGRAGGEFTAAGRTTGTGVIATLIIITITGARSVPDVLSITVTTICTAV